MNVTSAVRDSRVTLPIMPKASRSVNVADGKRGFQVRTGDPVMRWRSLELKFPFFALPNLMLVKT
jgi:hypothetical protein